MLSSSITPYIKHLSEKIISGFPGICYQCNFDTDGYSDSNVKQLLGDNLHESLIRAVAKRKSEFVAGRYLARKALIELGSNETMVGIGANRAPIWPDSFIGSITHSKSIAICAVANRYDLKMLGIDVEEFIDVSVVKDIAKNVLLTSEYPFLGSYTTPNPIVFTLIFSAKESLFKALHPHVGRYFDFSAAQTKDINFQTGKFTLELVQELAPSLPVGTTFEGLFEFDNNRVFTVIAQAY